MALSIFVPSLTLLLVTQNKQTTTTTTTTQQLHTISLSSVQSLTYYHNYKHQELPYDNHNIKVTE